MRKILEKFMKKYWKNAKKLEKSGKSQGNSSVQKSGNHATRYLIYISPQSKSLTLPILDPTLTKFPFHCIHVL